MNESDREQYGRLRHGEDHDPEVVFKKSASALNGFGMTALKHGDLEAAIDAFSANGELENPEIITLLRERMAALQDSENPEDKDQLQKASQRLLKN